MSERSTEAKARARAAAEALDRLTRGVTLGEVTLAELRRHRGKGVDDREAHLAHELPAEWATELARSVPPYETELDHLVKPKKD